MKRLLPCTLFGTALLVAWCAGVLYPCGFDSTFRVYLDRRFWQPLAKYEDSLGRPATVTAPKTAAPFAGMSGGGTSRGLIETREAYRARDWARCRVAAESALAGNLSGTEREEVLLIEAKVDLREGESGNMVALERSRESLRDFIRSSREPALLSEARGWLARAAYLSGDYPLAAKIYLDELADPRTIFSRENLVASLRMLFPYNGSGVRLSDHLDEYFDTPAHALFVVNLVTNPVYRDAEERAAMAEVAKKTIDVLERRSDLFGTGSESEALGLALVRASLYMGDTKRALSYAERIPAGSKTANSPEYLWMTAACGFLQGRYAEAEVPLLKMFLSEDGNRRDRLVASQGLVGVYHKLGRGADQLHAAFLYHGAARDEAEAPPRETETDYLTGPYYDFPYLPSSGWLVDLSYLLDVQLDDKDLADYLQRHGREARRIKVEIATPRERSAFEVVEYALAVRLARKERYTEAAGVFDRIGARPRAERMKRLAELSSKAKDPGLPSAEHLEALYAYAAFLEEHSTRVFFNDMLWYGYQRYMLLQESAKVGAEGDDYPPSVDEQGLTGAERTRFLARERRLKDEQDERWRAFKIFDKLVSEAGDSELGRRALAKALRCLDLTNTERFGREDEIVSAKKRLRSRSSRL